MAILLRAENLTKVFRSGNSDLVVLDDLQLEVEVGEMVAIVGESGSGKSTLLHILGALDKPTTGEIYFDQKPVSGFSEAEKDRLRNREFGFVWQLHFLLPEFTARENVMMPLLIRGMGSEEAGRSAQEWLERVGLQQRLSHRAGELSPSRKTPKPASGRSIPHPLWACPARPKYGAMYFSRYRTPPQ